MGTGGTGGTCAIDVVATDGECRAKLITLALNQDWSVGNAVAAVAAAVAMFVSEANAK